MKSGFFRSMILPPLLAIGALAWTQAGCNESPTIPSPLNSTAELRVGDSQFTFNNNSAFQDDSLQSLNISLVNFTDSHNWVSITLAYPTDAWQNELRIRVSRSRHTISC